MSDGMPNSKAGQDCLNSSISIIGIISFTDAMLNFL